MGLFLFSKKRTLVSASTYDSCALIERKEKKVFINNECVYVIVKWKNIVFERDSLKYEFYDPNNELYFEDRKIARILKCGQGEGETVEEFELNKPYNNYAPKKNPGKWKVKIFCNENNITTLDFDIR